MQVICKTHGEQLWHALDECTVNVRKYIPIGSCFSGKQIAFSGTDLCSGPWWNLEKELQYRLMMLSWISVIYQVSVDQTVPQSKTNNFCFFQNYRKYPKEEKHL